MLVRINERSDLVAFFVTEKFTQEIKSKSLAFNDEHVLAAREPVCNRLEKGAARDRHSHHLPLCFAGAVGLLLSTHLRKHRIADICQFGRVSLLHVGATCAKRFEIGDSLEPN